MERFWADLLNRCSWRLLQIFTNTKLATKKLRRPANPLGTSVGPIKMVKLSKHSEQGGTVRRTRHHLLAAFTLFKLLPGPSCVSFLFLFARLEIVLTLRAAVAADVGFFVGEILAQGALFMNFQAKFVETFGRII